MSDQGSGLEPRAGAPGAASAHRLAVRSSSSPVQQAFADAYQAWLHRQEEETGQLNVFACEIDESAGVAEAYSQISELPGESWEDIFQRGIA